MFMYALFRKEKSTLILQGKENKYEIKKNLIFCNLT